MRFAIILLLLAPLLAGCAADFEGEVTVQLQIHNNSSGELQYLAELHSRDDLVLQAWRGTIPPGGDAAPTGTHLLQDIGQMKFWELLDGQKNSAAAHGINGGCSNGGPVFWSVNWDGRRTNMDHSCTEKAAFGRGLDGGNSG